MVMGHKKNRKGAVFMTIKRNLALLLSCLLISNTAAVSFAAENEEETEIYSTGSLEMTQEQISAFLEKVPKIVDVKPNALCRNRLNDEAGIDGSDLSGGMMNIVADGDEIITFADNIPSVMAVNNETVYPSKVDNSTETTFPVIGNQKKLNSCVGWSLAYYQLTNNANKIRGTAARRGSSNISENVYSPNWVYNLGNFGDNSGMCSNLALNVLYTYGCPAVNQVSIETSNSSAFKYLSWYPEASIWESALYNKCDVYYGEVNPDNLDTPITSPNSNYLNNIKKILADGYVVTIETYVAPNSDPYLPVVKTGRTSDNSAAYAWTEVRNVENGGHAVTIVGYDDNFKVDINGDGEYQQGEYGAFKIANSWGTGAEKHKKGYVWLSYDALNAVSAVKKTVHSERVPAMRNGSIYYFIKPMKEYKPLLTAEVELTAKYRDGITAYFGIEDAENSSNYYERKVTANEIVKDTPNFLTEFIAFGSGFGECNLSGTGVSQSGSVVFDFSSLLQEIELKENHRYNVYLKIRNYSDDTLTINSFKLKDHNTGEVITSNEAPLSTNSNGQTIKVNTEYSGSITTAKPDKTFTLNFNSKLNEATVDDTIITVVNDDEDYCVLDLELDEDEAKVYLSKSDRKFNNDFYNIKILSELQSKGGNYLNKVIDYPFYVPFH